MSVNGDNKTEWTLAEQLNAQIVAEYGEKESISIIARLGGYKEPPPTIDQFIEEDDYMGYVLGGGNLYPEWKQQLRAVYPNPFYSPYPQIICAGAIGIGKTVMSKAITAYDLLKLTFVEDPQKTYQLLPKQEIVVCFVNATQALAKRVLADPFYDWITASPYFRREMAQLHVEHQSSGKRTKATELFTNNIGMVSASRNRDVVGMAAIGACISEIEEMDRIKSQAKDVYRGIQRRMHSRFERGEGFLEPGHLVVDCSAKYQEGFQAQLMEEARKDPLNRTLIIEKAQWEVLVPAGKVELKSDKTFRLFVGGSGGRDPCILIPGRQYNFPEALIIDVPEDYRILFEQDIYGAVRDIAGRCTVNIHKFLSQIAKFLEAMSKDKVGTLEEDSNPCDTEVIELDFDNPDDRIINHIDVSKLSKDMPYCVHIDIGYASGGCKTGLAMTRPSGEKLINKVGPTLQHSTISDTCFRTDLVLAIGPKPGKEVPIAKLRNFLIDLKRAGIRIVAASCDTFQSQQFLQEMRDYGIPSEVVSVDKTRAPYDFFNQVIIEKRWSGPYHAILEREFLGLVDAGSKIILPEQSEIDKSIRPSKDMSDAVAGSVYLCNLKNSSGAATVALENYVDAMRNADRRLDLQDAIFDMGMRNRQKGFFKR